jgi:predicted nucleotidyltransferase
MKFPTQVAGDEELAAHLPIPLPRLRELLRSAGVSAAYLFGSRARGEERSGSDLDLFVEFEKTDVDAYFTLLWALEEQAGCPVDLATGIDKFFQRYVEPDLLRII